MIVEDEGKRARRATRFRGDFETKFDFGSSDDDIDDEGGKKKKSSATPKPAAQKVKRSKDCPGCGANVSLSVKECSFCDYQFTSKSMIQSAQSAAEESQNIRERFLFEPEREEDGSLIIQVILNRRPRRSGAQKWMNRDTVVSAVEAKYDFEYLVKFKDLSYLHIKWVSAAEIDTMNQKSKQTLQRYLAKLDRGEINEDDNEIEASFSEVERILDVREEEVTELIREELKDTTVIPVNEVVPEGQDSNLSSNINTGNIISTSRRASTSTENGTIKELAVNPTSNTENNSNPTTADIPKTASISSINSTEITASTDDLENFKPTPASKIFNHVERCRQVLNRMLEDPYASSFRDPVDTETYDDYLEVVDEPMCLLEVKKRLEDGEYNKYYHHLKFANDMRLIWRNCKIYNLYQSQIWYSAHTLSLMFERLFQGWVVSFSDGSIALSDPIGQPWQTSCRVCLIENNDEDLMLCDHCDSPYHIYCLRPKLKKVPDGPWVCPRCVAWFARTGKKMLSATAEDEARQYADGATVRKVIKVLKKKYLVKWRGLSYKECTWETVEDINDDERIKEYHLINDNPPDEPPLTKAEIGYELSKDRRSQLLPPTRPNTIQDLDAMVYAQIRSYHFLKWLKIPPKLLLKECGPAAFAATLGFKQSMLSPVSHSNSTLLLLTNLLDSNLTIASETPKLTDKDVVENDSSKVIINSAKNSLLYPTSLDPTRNEIFDLLGTMVCEVARIANLLPHDPYPARPKLPSVYKSPSEIEVCITKTGVYGKPGGLGIQVGNYYGSTIVVAFKNLVYNIKGAVESTGRVKIGDAIVGINGQYVNHLSYEEVIKLLRDTSTDDSFNYMYLRLLRLPIYDVNSYHPDAIKIYFTNKLRVMNMKYGNFDVDDGEAVSNPVITDLSLRLHEVRSLYFGVYPVVKSTEDYRIFNAVFDTPTAFKLRWTAEYHDLASFNRVVIGEYDDEYEAAIAYDKVIKALSNPDMSKNISDNSLSPNGSKDIQTESTADDSAQKSVYPMNESANEITENSRNLDKQLALTTSKTDDDKLSNGLKIFYDRVINFDDKLELTATVKILKKLVEKERIENKTRLQLFYDKYNPISTEAVNPGKCEDDTATNPKIVESKEDQNGIKDEICEEEKKEPSITQVNIDHDVPTEEGKESNNDEVVEEVKAVVENVEEDENVDEAVNVEEDDIHSFDSRDSDSELGLDDDDEDDEDVNSEDEDDDDEKAMKDHELLDDDEYEWKPKKGLALTSESDGPMGRLLRAVNESDNAPIRSDWSNFILENFYSNPNHSSVINDSDASSGKKYKKIYQIDMASNEIIREWDGIAAITRNLNHIPAADIQAVLCNKLDMAGGFLWKFSNNSYRDIGDDENDEDEEAKKATEAAVDWKTKLYQNSKEYKSGGMLRDYQVDGLNWLLSCWYTKRSSILADEMGLGKTVQVVTFLDHLFDIESIKGPYLVCVPLSTIQHWKREADSWTNMITCLYHDAGGGRDMRDIIREYEWYYKGHSRRLLKFHLLITTYDDLIRDYEELAEIPWRVVVVDEAHRLKNLNSKLLECMRTVVSKGMIAYGYQHRILMSGTPLQNNTSELWTLLNFIEPAKFPNIDKFNEKYKLISTQEQVESLQYRLAPHLLRRVKEDVAKDIPPKEETIIDVELTTIQKQYYRAIFERNHSFLLTNLKGSVPKLMNIQMELRKCCNHPFLVDGVEQAEMENLDYKMVHEPTVSSPPAPSPNQSVSLYRRKGQKGLTEYERRRMEQYVIPTSGKMVLIDKLLPKLLKEKHKVLIFSQMVKMIDIIDEYCEFRGYSCERLDGRISGNERQKSIDRFNREENSFVFLLSTRAGGVGINLTGADTVIIFDSDWNPQNDLQAMARCHRIGQQKNVTIYRLITRRSFEASMFERASKKLGLEQALLGSRHFGNDMDGEDTGKSNSKMDAKELEQLLKEGAYSVLLEDNSEEIKEFFEQDIDSLLQQRAHVMVTETSAPTESWLNKKNLSGKGKTRKSLFTGDSAMEHAEIDVNDPDFWKKVLPDLVTPDSMLDRLDHLTMNPDDDYDDEDDDDEDDDFPEEVDEDDIDDDIDVGNGRKRKKVATKASKRKSSKRDTKSSSNFNPDDSVEKYVRDLTQMIRGMLDLKSRGQLPEMQREITMTLLLKISIKGKNMEHKKGLKGFSPAFIAQVNDWLATLENNRRRARALSDQKQRSHSGRSPRGTGRGRGRGLSRRLSGIGVEDPIDGIDPKTPSVRRGRGRGRGRGSTSTRGRRILSNKDSSNRSVTWDLEDPEDLDVDDDHDQGFDRLVTDRDEYSDEGEFPSTDNGLDYDQDTDDQDDGDGDQDIDHDEDRDGDDSGDDDTFGKPSSVSKSGKRMRMSGGKIKSKVNGEKALRRVSGPRKSLDKDKQKIDDEEDDQADDLGDEAKDVEDTADIDDDTDKVVKIKKTRKPRDGTIKKRKKQADGENDDTVNDEANKPAPELDENGEPIKKAKRKYVRRKPLEGANASGDTENDGSEKPKKRLKLVIHRTSSEDEEVKVDKEDNDKEVKTSVDSVVLSDENVDIVTEDVSIINTLESDNGESNGIDINPVSVHDEIEDVRDITVESR